MTPQERSMKINPSCRYFAMLVVVATALGSPRLSHAIAARTSIAYRAEHADVVVVGRISAYEKNKRVDLTFNEGGSADVDRGPRTQRWLNQGTLQVTEVLKGTVDLPRTIPVLSPGVFDLPDHPGEMREYAENDERVLQAGTDGIWFLKQAAWDDYRLLNQGYLPLDSLNHVKECIWQIEARYRYAKPGLPRDDESWVIPINATGMQMAVAPDGTVFMCGVVRGQVRLEDGFPPIETGRFARFTARAHYNGTFMWKQTADCDGGTPVGDIVVDRNGQFTVGILRRSGLGSTTSERQGATIEHNDHAGNSEWVQEIESSSTDGAYVSSVTLGVRETGEVVAVCSFRGRVEWDGHVFESAGGHDILLGEIDNRGKLRWSKAIGGVDDEFVAATEVSKRGDIVLGGSVGGKKDEWGRRKSAAVIVMCSANGDERWRHTLSDSSGSAVQAIACTRDGGVIVSIEVGSQGIRGSQTSLIYSWNRDGKLKWSKPGGGADIAIGPRGEIVVVGTYGSRNVGIPHLPAAMGDDDLYVQCLTSKGKLMWTRRDGGMGTEGAWFVDVSWGRLIIGGGYDGMSYIAGQVIEDYEPKQYSSFIVNVPFPSSRSR